MQIELSKRSSRLGGKIPYLLRFARFVVQQEVDLFCKSVSSSQHRLCFIAWGVGNFASKNVTHAVIARIEINMLNQQHWKEIYKDSFPPH